MDSMKPAKDSTKLIKPKTIKAMVNCLAEKIQPDQIYLFGSYAWGKPTGESDIDLCLVFQDIRPKDALSIMVNAAKTLKEFETACDIIVRSTERMEGLRPFHAPLESKILRKGKLLYDAATS